MVLAPDDRMAYLRLAATAAPCVETALGEGVVANRASEWSVEPPNLTLRPWRVERRAFGNALRRLARAHPTLVFADVADCFGSIGPQLVRASLDAVGAHGACEVERFLSGLGGAGIRGLPVGPEPSALFANAVLRYVDSALESEGIAHLRWVDDMVLGVAGPAEAERGLALIRGALERIGLRANERKTRVVVDPRLLLEGLSGLGGRAVRVG